MPAEFSWPEGKRAAVSVSFDDARPSQLDAGMPILDEYDVKGTFYASLGNLKARTDDWRAAVRGGHEVGNHTVSHPCSGNFGWGRKPLEDYSLADMEKELTGANVRIADVIGSHPATFAYPCGQKFVGRGEGVQSYVPLVARHFLVGRGFRDEACNLPAFCDLAQVYGVDFDCHSFDQIMPYIEKTLDARGWLIFAGHDIHENKYQGVQPDTLHALCRFVKDPENGVWIDTIAGIGRYVLERRAAAP